MDTLEKKEGMILQFCYLTVRVEGSGRQILPRLPSTNPGGSTNFFRVVSILGFASHTFSVATTPLCCGREKAAVDERKKGHGCIPTESLFQRIGGRPDLASALVPRPAVWPAGSTQCFVPRTYPKKVTGNEWLRQV